MPRIHHVKKAAKDNSVCKKGESYYWWCTRITSGKSYIKRKHLSKNPPRQSQLTSSPFLQSLLAIQENISDAKPQSLGELLEMRDDWVNDINELRDETQEKLDNMPDGLRESDSGQVLQERVDALESWASDIENADIPNEEDVDAVSPDDDDPIADAIQTALEELQSLEPGI